MTTSRIVRGTKGRLFIYICAVLFIIGIIACYNNTRTQLDDVLKTHEICRQQQENLSTQLQVIFDYKQRLEKSLKTEKAEHQQAKIDLETKLNEERNKNDKTMKEENVRFDTLQQHYNLLQTQHDDFKEECSKIQHEQSDEVNKLQAKLKEIQEQLKKTDADKIKTIGHLKVTISQLQDENYNLKEKLKIKDSPYPVVIPQKHVVLEHPAQPIHNLPSFSKQIHVGDHYVIPDTNNNNNNNVADSPINQNVVGPVAPNAQGPDQAVLLPPVEGAASNRSSTPTSVQRGVGGVMVGGGGGVPVLPLAVSPSTPETRRRNVLEGGQRGMEDIRPIPHPKAQVPFGVAPEPPLLFDQQQQQHPPANMAAKMDDGAVNEEFDGALNNRYRANIIETAVRAEKQVEEQQQAANADVNGANEVFGDIVADNPDNNLDAKMINEKNGLDEAHDDAQEKDDDQQLNDLNDPNEDDDPEDLLIRNKEPAVRN